MGGVIEEFKDLYRAVCDCFVEDSEEIILILLFPTTFAAISLFFLCIGIFVQPEDVAFFGGLSLFLATVAVVSFISVGYMAYLKDKYSGGSSTYRQVVGTGVDNLFDGEPGFKIGRMYLNSVLLGGCLYCLCLGNIIVPDYAVLLNGISALLFTADVIVNMCIRRNVVYLEPHNVEPATEQTYRGFVEARVVDQPRNELGRQMEPGRHNNRLQRNNRPHAVQVVRWANDNDANLEMPSDDEGDALIRVVL